VSSLKLAGGVVYAGERPTIASVESAALEAVARARAGLPVGTPRRVLVAVLVALELDMGDLAEVAS